MFIWIELQNNNQMKCGIKPFFQCTERVCDSFCVSKTRFVCVWIVMREQNTFCVCAGFWHDSNSILFLYKSSSILLNQHLLSLPELCWVVLLAIRYCSSPSTHINSRTNLRFSQLYYDLALWIGKLSGKLGPLEWVVRLSILTTQTQTKSHQ